MRAAAVVEGGVQSLRHAAELVQLLQSVNTPDQASRGPGEEEWRGAQAEEEGEEPADVCGGASIGTLNNLKRRGGE